VNKWLNFGGDHDHRKPVMAARPHQSFSAYSDINS